MIAFSKNADSTVERALEAFARTADSVVPAQNGEQHPARRGSVLVVTGSSVRNLTEKIQLDGFKSVQLFALLPSTRTSSWLLPLKNRPCALSGSQIYAPYAWRARMLKKLLLAAIQVNSTAWARHRVLIASTRPLLLQQFVTEVTGEREPVFSLLLGTPGPFRKLTIQVMRADGEILGYIKLSLTPAAIARVRAEAAMLQRLSLFPELHPHLPRLIHAGEWQGGYLLFQSPGPLRPGPVEFGQAHQRFLQALWSVHSTEKAGRVLVKGIAARWQKIDSLLDPMLRELGERTLERAALDLSDVTVRCGIMHGDFAPWNTRLGDKGDLFVFDWESAVWEAPISWDVFHFHGQIASLLKKKTNGSSFLLPESPSTRASFLLYLLSSICHSFEAGSCTRAGIGYWLTILQEQLSRGQVAIPQSLPLGRPTRKRNQ